MEIQSERSRERPDVSKELGEAQRKAIKSLPALPCVSAHSWEQVFIVKARIVPVSPAYSRQQ